MGRPDERATQGSKLASIDSIPRQKVTAAASVVRDSRGRALILQRGHSAPWKPLFWNLPGGEVDQGETPEAAAIREVREETRLTVADPQPLGAFEYDPVRC